MYTVISTFNEFLEGSQIACDMLLFPIDFAFSIEFPSLSWETWNNLISLEEAIFDISICTLKLMTMELKLSIPCSLNSKYRISQFAYITFCASFPTIFTLQCLPLNFGGFTCGLRQFLT